MSERSSARAVRSDSPVADANVVELFPRRGIDRASRIDLLFESQVDRTPDALAVQSRGERESYAGLDARANRVAAALVSLGVTPDQPVGIMVDRTVDLLAAILGVLKAGGAYLPLDPDYPPARLAYMVADGGVSILIADRDLGDELGYCGTVVRVDSDLVRLSPSTRPGRLGCGHDLAYVIYTSGSSGAPKAVLVEHRTIVRFIQWSVDLLTPEEFAVSAAATSICFDPHVFEMLAPLCGGGSVLLKRSPLEPFLPGERPTLIGGVPSVMAAAVARGPVPSSVLVASTGGERLTDGLVKAMRAAGIPRILNQYGPTEATIAASAGWVEPGDEGADPSIGFPICGAVFTVVDAGGAEVEHGEVGDLRISGPVLARGYGGAAAHGERGFRVDPATGERYYSTGDVVRRREDGAYDYVGRVGDFIKLNGRRISPGEIEGALLRLDGIEAAAVTFGEDGNGRGRLIAHVVGSGGESITLRGLRAALSDWLPHAMLPTVLHVHKAFPTTLNNKIDRQALPGVPVRDAEPTAAEDYLPIMRAVSDIFSSELRCGEVGPDDDFFELGGDSLSAVAVALAVEDAVGRPVSPALLFHASTPRQLHEVLENERQEASRHVVELREGDGGPPIFCMPELFGRPMSFLTMARRMPPGQAVCGLTVGPLASSMMASPSMDVLARGYISAIRERCPAGPFRIVGFSFGGVFAQEVARRLHEAGETVSLVLLDASNRKAPIPPVPFGGWLFRSWTRNARALGVLRAGKRGMIRAGEFVRMLRGGYDRLMPDWIPAGDVELSRAHVEVELAHVPRPYAGRALVVTCREHSVPLMFRDMDGMLGWRHLLTGDVVHRVADTGHQEIVRTGYVDHLVGEMTEFFAGDVEISRRRRT